MRYLLGSLLITMTLFFAGCDAGQVRAPSIQDLQEDVKLVEFKLPDGHVLPCLYYSKDGRAGYSGYSWLILDCDWDNIQEIR